MERYGKRGYMGEPHLMERDGRRGKWERAMWEQIDGEEINTRRGEWRAIRQAAAAATGGEIRIEPVRFCRWGGKKRRVGPANSPGPPVPFHPPSPSPPSPSRVGIPLLIPFSSPPHPPPFPSVPESGRLGARTEPSSSQLLPEQQNANGKKHGRKEKAYGPA